MRNLAFTASALAACLGLAISMPAAAEITASSVLCTSALASTNQGCLAQTSYLTGSAVGGTIHTIDFNNNTTTDPNGVATYTAFALGFDGGARPNFDTVGHWGFGATTITFNTAIVYFGLYWGSNDGTGNTITFKNGSTTIATFDGTSTGYVSYTQDSYYSFNASNGTVFNTVIINNGPFETDNHAYVTAASATATPEPSTFGIAALGLIGLGASWQRKRRI